MQNHRLICLEPNVLRFEQTEVPVCGMGEALIKLRTIGVCGTDYHAFRGKQPFFAYPRVLGHELAAEVVDVAEGPHDLRIGDAVTVMPYLECGTCIACRSGKPNACQRLRVIGVHLDGGMQEYMAVPFTRLIRTGSLTRTQVAAIEPLAIGLHAVRRAKLRPDQNVLIVGGGPIGLAVMRFAKLAGARVLAMDLSETRLAYCRTWAKADEGIQPSARSLQELESLTDGELPEVVIDATGSSSSMMQAFQYAASGGKVVYVSLVQDDIRFSDPEFHRKELTLMGSRAATREEFHTVIDRLLDGQVDAAAYVTHRAPFRDSLEAFQSWLQPEAGVIKAHIELD